MSTTKYQEDLSTIFRNLVSTSVRLINTYKYNIELINVSK